ncbi:TIGR03750 family conjugal transfer protein [Caviibacterium pharyngocola]|uniref:TIGR03750 family conjugal transfer protein n=1 Tax=Caviibacterium pharyngocola TaxID=28159 RepID=A0A2M8RV70_9PAST|nr:TIGR03750 family conjugal transfer protein [Caviibacterium pharyngocola]PJG82779.1 TIGR03750 family conjugal transfer protein [Caviibacterium pharyngocola]
MSTSVEEDIAFLPTRLNREATVYGGMTVTEFGISAVIGFVIGLIVGLFLWILTGFWLLMPALAMLLCIVTVLIGKSVVARMKRGKPEAYLNRLIEVKMDNWLSGGRFIERDGFWATRRQWGK